MIKKIIALGLIGTCLCQYNEQESQGQSYDQPSYYKKPPQILSHKQSLNHDGNFKYAFASENGLLQGESISPDGSRTGAYAYVDPSGKKISVKYIAGKEGFKILEGDHIPKPPPHAIVSSHPGFSNFRGPEPEYRPQIQKPTYHYKPEFSKPIFSQYKPEGLRPFSQYKPQDSKPAYKVAQGRDDNGPEVFSKPPQFSSHVHERSNEVQPYPYSSGNSLETKEPEYNDEPGKANSFGSGYSFEFSG